MNFGIIVVTYNRLNLLKECVEHIENQTVPVEKIVIVDNNSSDGTKEYLQSLSKESYIVDFRNENGGASSGFARGLELIQNEDVDWILIIDDDAHIEPDYLAFIMQAAQRYPNIFAFSGTVYEGERIATSHRKIISDWIKFKTMEVSQEQYNIGFFEYDLSSFCGLTIKKSLLQQVGLPNVNYFTQYTDTDFSIRIRKHTKIYNINDSKLYHKVKIVSNNCDKKELNYKSYYSIRNGIYTRLLYTEHKRRQRVKITNFYLIWIARNIIMSIIDNKNSRIYINNVNIIFCALRDGLNGKLGKNKRYLP